MKLLISGLSGSIGSSLHTVIKKYFQRIAVLVRESSFEESSYSSYEVIRLGKGFPDDEILKFNPDVVINLVGCSSSSELPNNVRLLVGSNIEFGINLLRSISKCDTKFYINIGSAAEFKNNNVHEYLASSLYAASKTAFRPFLDYFGSSGSFCVIDLVVYFVYGTNNLKKKRVFDYFIDAIDSNQPIAFSDGYQELDFIHISDLVRLFESIFESIRNNKINNSCIIYAGSGEAYSLREISKIIENKIERKLSIKWGAIPKGQNVIELSRAPIHLNTPLVNWEPAVSIDDGIINFLNSNNIYVVKD